MKTFYRVWDKDNDFSVVIETTKDHILHFKDFLEDYFGWGGIEYAEVEPTVDDLFEAYANYLENDGFDHLEKEIADLRNKELTSVYD